MCAHILCWLHVNGRWPRRASTVLFKEQHYRLFPTSLFHINEFSVIHLKYIRLLQGVWDWAFPIPLCSFFLWEHAGRGGRWAPFSTNQGVLPCEWTWKSRVSQCGMSFHRPLVHRSCKNSLWIQKAPVFAAGYWVNMAECWIKASCIFIWRLSEWENEGDVRGCKWHTKQWSCAWTASEWEPEK